MLGFTRGIACPVSLFFLITSEGPGRPTRHDRHDRHGRHVAGPATKNSRKCPSALDGRPPCILQRQKTFEGTPMTSAADLALAATDDELLLQYKHLDDRAAFSALYDRYWADMFAYACLQLPRGGQAAEDMVQEAFLEFVEHHKSYSPGGVRALLYLIVKRCCTRHHRRTGRQTWLRSHRGPWAPQRSRRSPGGPRADRRANRRTRSPGRADPKAGSGAAAHAAGAAHGRVRSDSVGRDGRRHPEARRPCNPAAQARRDAGRTKWPRRSSRRQLVSPPASR